ncbi:MAG: hypothetical protein FWG02_03820 [Holophagaceae bacterium]|nr:hypothetical protein [Holophagaceae bacterium]
MPDFEIQSIVKWLHIISMVLAGGTMPVCLILSGFEESHEDVRGISAVIWKKLAVWGMRFTVAFGIILLIMYLAKGGKPFSQPHLMLKIGLTPILIFVCETATKNLGNAKRGAAMLAVVLILIITFVSTNGNAFVKKTNDNANTNEQADTPPPRVETQEPIPDSTVKSPNSD